MKAFFRILGRILAGLWRALNTAARFAVNVALLLVLALVVSLFWRPLPPVPDGSALLLRPAGTLVEQAALPDPFGLLRAGPAPVAQTTLHDLLEALEAARDDPRIEALVIETDDLGAASLTKLAELRAAIAAFREKGKPVLARGERMTQAQYYLASAAEEVHLGPDGFALVPGIARYITYFGNALDKLGVKLRVFRVGEYKSFSEQFTRSDMSQADREVSRDLLAGVWNFFRDDVATSRGIPADVLERYVQSYDAVLAQSGGDAARAARESDLVDALTTRDQWRDLLKRRVGTSDDGKDYLKVEVDDYLAAVRSRRPHVADRVAVLVAQGAIVDGSESQSAVGGDSLARVIRAAREDERVKAVVLRIDSPGGSAWASEVIRRELELTAKAGKPVVASMSSVAASGGYWIAVGADEIWAHPATLTGSIGIFAMFPELDAPLAEVGITSDGVATAPLAGAFDPRRPLPDEAAKVLQLGIEHGYRRFLETVAAAREMSVGDVDRVARGRVWTGATAKELGLVDQLGGLDAAIAAAAARAGLERYETFWPEAEVGPGQRLLQRLIEAVAPAAALTPSPFATMLVDLWRDANELLRWNDPGHLYTHCLCEAP